MPPMTKSPYDTVGADLDNVMQTYFAKSQELFDRRNAATRLLQRPPLRTLKADRALHDAWRSGGSALRALQEAEAPFDAEAKELEVAYRTALTDMFMRHGWTEQDFDRECVSRILRA